MALTGFLVGDKCYPDVTTARDIYYGSAVPTVAPGPSGSSYFGVFTKDGGGWKFFSYQVANGTQTLVASSTYLSRTFPACDPSEGFTDGMLVGWGVLAAMLAAWGCRQMGWSLPR